MQISKRNNSIYKIENGNWEYFKETTTQPKSRQQPKSTNGSSTQRLNPALGVGHQLTPKYNCGLVH